MRFHSPLSFMIQTRLVFVWCMLTLPLIALCQNQQTTDSLLIELREAKSDSARVRVFTQLGLNLMKSEPEKSFSYSQQALELAKKINYKQYIVKAYQAIAGYYYYQGDPHQALLYSEKTLPIIQELGDAQLLCSMYSNLGTLANVKGDFPTALDYMQKSLRLAEQIKDSARIALVLSNIGIIYSDISDYNTSLEYFIRSLHTYDALGMKAQMANDYYNISNIYRLSKGDEEKMLMYCQLSLNTAKEANDKIQEALSLKHFGEIYLDKKDYDKALDYFNQSLKLNQRLGDKINIGDCYSSIGFIRGQQGAIAEAVRLLNESLVLFEQAGYRNGIAQAYNYLGVLHLKHKNYADAVAAFQQSAQVARASRNRSLESRALKGLADTYSASGDYKHAYELLLQHKQVEDSIVSHAAIEKNIEMEARYNIGNQEKAIALLTKDKTIQELALRRQVFLKNAFIAGLLLMCAMFFFVYRNYRTRQLLKLQTIRNKIASDLHDDVGSTLSSISIFSDIARQQSKEVIPMLDQIGESSRQMLESMADIVWTINPENDNFEKIILRMRSFAFELLGSKKIDFQFDADESVNDLKLSMDARKNLYLIFKEAVNNMVKYADANTAYFSLKNSKNNLSLLIRDNGKGFDITSLTQGNGLKNMRKRALEIGAQFQIESEPDNGTTIHVTLPTA